MVNIFHPHLTAEDSLACLDDRRLGKQRLEALQIIRLLDSSVTVTRGFSRHPAVLSYRGYVPYLKLYYNACLEEWCRRGKKNTMAPLPVECEAPNGVVVPWFIPCVPRLMADRAALLRKDPVWYGRQFASLNIPEYYHSLGYCWISKLTEDQAARLKSWEEEDQEALAKEICAPISKRAASARPCAGAVKSGPRRGLPCSNSAYAPETFCGVHRRGTLSGGCRK